MIRICFICFGNICRSPLAKGVFAHMVQNQGIDHRFMLDSAGVDNYNVGNPPDSRSKDVAAKHGIMLAGQARQFMSDDFAKFDLIVAMDSDNQNALRNIAPTSKDCNKICLLREFDPQGSDELNIPDPYYGGPEGFDLVYQIIERSCNQLLAQLLSE